MYIYMRAGARIGRATTSRSDKSQELAAEPYMYICIHICLYIYVYT